MIFLFMLTIQKFNRNLDLDFLLTELIFSLALRPQGLFPGIKKKSLSFHLFFFSKVRPN